MDQQPPTSTADSYTSTPSFGEWLVRRFTADAPVESLTSAETERACSSAGSLVCGAAFIDPETVGAGIQFTTGHVEEAMLVATHTAEGFKAALEDQESTAITWPWDHLAARTVWLSRKELTSTAERLGDEIQTIGTTYAVAHREQLAHVIELWQRVAKNIKPGGIEEPDLVQMATQMFNAYKVEAGV